MHPVNRLRSLSQDYLLPLVIGALALRALIPMGFMPGDGNALSITAALCMPAGGTEQAGSEQIELPGTAHTMQCEYCLSPLSGPPLLLATADAPLVHDFQSFPAHLLAPHSRFALDRAQIPRAPPSA
jgi:hypothetical protein